ncbi:acyltransferase [Niabella aquatica]
MGKPHYEALDGLRGIAAIAVVIFHCYEILTPDLTQNPIAHGFLAVDFFFCLSGFVIGYAYDSRIYQIGVKRFFINRLIRLQPLVVLGTALGLAGLFSDPFTISPVQEFGWWKIIIATVCSVLMLPCPVLGRYGNVFPLNAPAWSLSMEYFINLVYALVLVRLTKKLLLIFLIIAIAFIIWTGWHRGNLLGGWNDITFADGYARVVFSFIAGLVVYRFRLTIKNKLHFFFYAVVLAAVFLVPHVENDWITEVFLVILLFPLLVACGAGSHVSGRVKKICTFLGAISYPLYMTHYWMIWILGNYAATDPGERNLYLFSGIILILALILAWATLKFFDEPARKWLTMRSKGKISNPES